MRIAFWPFISNTKATFRNNSVQKASGIDFGAHELSAPSIYNQDSSYILKIPAMSRQLNHTS